MYDAHLFTVFEIEPAYLVFLASRLPFANRRTRLLVAELLDRLGIQVRYSKMCLWPVPLILLDHLLPFSSEILMNETHSIFANVAAASVAKFAVHRCPRSIIRSMNLQCDVRTRFLAPLRYNSVDTYRRLPTLRCISKRLNRHLCGQTKSTTKCLFAIFTVT